MPPIAAPVAASISPARKIMCAFVSFPQTASYFPAQN
jgi:hypothetical protein